VARVEGWQEIGAREQGRAQALSGRAGRQGSLLNKARELLAERGR